jgi:hypothetical protein
MKSLAAFALAGVALGLAACGGPPSAASPAPRGPASTAQLTSFAAGPWGTFRSKRFDLELPLPDGHAWRIDDHTTGWLVATHAPTASTLLVRTWREDANMNRARCEERARSWRALPDREGTDLIEQFDLALPPDHDTHAEVRAGRGGARADTITGAVLAFGGFARKCFAYVYATSASGPGAEAAVGDRLAVMAHGSLEKLTFTSELAPARSRGPTLEP